MTAKIRVNTDFNSCVKNIRHGLSVLAKLNISDHYTPKVEFHFIPDGSPTGSFALCSIPTRVSPQSYIAAFDLDWTLVANEHKLYSGSASADDIVLLPGRREALTALVKSGYTLAVFTNQNAKKPKPLKRIIARFTKFLLELGLPCYLFSSTGKNQYRKPAPDMWKYMQRLIPDIKYAFYVGDAAGRPQDFSDSDKIFAQSVGVPFFTPEEFFPCQKIEVTDDVVVLVGAPGTGKTKIAKGLEKKGYMVVSRDALGGNKRKYLTTLSKIIKKRKYVVADATNGSQITREKIYSIAHELGRTITVIYLLRSGQGWNKLRPNPVPAVVYHIYYKNMIPPTLDKGVNVVTVTDPCI